MQDIGNLFFRRLNDELSESDHIKLDEWMDQQGPVSRQFFEEMTEWEEIQAALHGIYQIDELPGRTFKKIHVEKILAISTSAEPPPLI